MRTKKFQCATWLSIAHQCAHMRTLLNTLKTSLIFTTQTLAAELSEAVLYQMAPKYSKNHQILNCMKIFIKEIQKWKEFYNISWNISNFGCQFFTKFKFYVYKWLNIKLNCDKTSQTQSTIIWMKSRIAYICFNNWRYPCFLKGIRILLNLFWHTNDSEELFTLLRYYKREQTLAITFLENNNQQDCQLLPYIKILGTF